MCFSCEIMWITCERPKYTCVLHEITWKSHNTHILKNNYHMCMAKTIRYEHKTTCDNASFTCESLNLHASVRSTQVCDLNVCVFHRWPCGIYIEPHVDDNLKNIITWSHMFKPLIKCFHMWTCETEYHNMWTSITHILKRLPWLKTYVIEQTAGRVIVWLHVCRCEQKTPARSNVNLLHACKISLSCLKLTYAWTCYVRYQVVSHVNTWNEIFIRMWKSIQHKRNSPSCLKTHRFLS